MSTEVRSLAELGRRKGSEPKNGNRFHSSNSCWRAWHCRTRWAWRSSWRGRPRCQGQGQAEPPSEKRQSDLLQIEQSENIHMLKCCTLEISVLPGAPTSYRWTQHSRLRYCKTTLNSTQKAFMMFTWIVPLWWCRQRQRPCRRLSGRDHQGERCISGTRGWTQTCTHCNAFLGIS